MSYFSKALVIGVGVLLPILSSAAVTVRFVARQERKQAILMDDFLSCLSWYLVTGAAVTLIVGAFKDVIGVHSGAEAGMMGKHGALSQAREDFSSYSRLLHIEFAFTLLYTISMGFIKLIPLCTYRRAFTGKFFQACNWTLIALVLSWTVSFFFANLLGCGADLGVNWSTVPDARAVCIDAESRSLAQAATGMLLDLWIVALPIGFLRTEQYSRASKGSIGVTGVMAALAVVFSVVCVAFQAELHQAGHLTTKVFGLYASDILGFKGLYLYWQLVELGVTMIACALPAPLFLHGDAQRVMNFARGRPSSGALTWTRRMERSESMDSWPGSETTFFAGPHKMDAVSKGEKDFAEKGDFDFSFNKV